MESHPHLSSGRPCTCPWGRQLNTWHFGAIKEASKLDWLKGRPDVQNDLRKDLIVNHHLDRHYNSPELDPLLPWIMREYKKGRIRLNDFPQDEINHLETFIDDYNEFLQAGGDPHSVEGQTLGAAIRDQRDMAEKAVRRSYALEHNPELVDEFYDPQQIYRPDFDWDYHTAEDMPLDDAMHGYANMLVDMRNRRQAIDPMQHDLESMHGLYHNWWLENQARKRSELGEIYHRYPDNWTIRRLHSPEEVRDEGNEMGHCVGGYTPNERTHIYSLRDHRNYPHATIEIRHPNGGEGPEGGAVWQIQGKENNEPIDEYKERLADWFQSLHPAPHVPYGEDAFHKRPQYIEDALQWGHPDYYPEDEYYNDDPYRLSPHAAEDYGLDAEEPQHEWEGPPKWNHVLDDAMHEYTPYNELSPRPAHNIYKITDLRHMIDEYTPHEEENLINALDERLPEDLKTFYNKHYTQNHPLGYGPVEQWNEWPIGQYHNLLRGSQAPITDPDGDPLTVDRSVHPDQMELFQDDPYYHNPNYHLNQDKPYIPWHSFSKTAKPMYYRWAFDPASGDVHFGHNEDAHPSEIEYHGDDPVDKANQHRGFAYRIGGGWRITDREHKPVEDPFVYSQIIKSLRDGWTF